MIGVLVFPGFQLLDAAGPISVFEIAARFAGVTPSIRVVAAAPGPVQVLSNVPGAKVHLIWKRIEPVPSDSVLVLTPTTTFADCPQLDVICVPGGRGTDDMVNDEEVLDFLRAQASGAKYITSVCTGSLVLGAAGLLRGYRATTHWSAMDYLAPYGATPEKTRVCVDRNRVSGGGVTAGIDFALTLVSIMVDRPTAELIQLGLPFDAKRAADLGLVTRVIPDQRLLATATETAQRLAEKPAGALQACKWLMRRPIREQLEQAAKFENEEFAARLCSADAKEAFSAFFQKRLPDFTKALGA